jgi:hypothetical protein
MSTAVCHHLCAQRVQRIRAACVNTEYAAIIVHIILPNGFSGQVRAFRTDVFFEVGVEVNLVGASGGPAMFTLLST